MPAVSIIIPAFNEETQLTRLLPRLAGSGAEVIVSVAEGDAVTAACAARFGATVVTGAKGRGAQLHQGALKARGDIFLFCHADTLLPDGWREAVKNTLAPSGVAGGAFRLAIDSPRPAARLLERGANLRGKWLGLVYGDQALFATRMAYFTAGGFRPLPLMEDADLVRRLKRAGRFVLLNDAVRTSARRWEKDGYYYGTARNTVLAALCLMGVSPATLFSLYRRFSR